MNRALKLLFVDDDDSIRTIAKLSLELDKAMEVRAAESATRALALLRAADWVPDVLLTDMHMPPMDGLTLMREARALPGFAALPVILFTASARRSELERFVGAGATGVIVKPFDPLLLADEVRASLSAA